MRRTASALAVISIAVAALAAPQAGARDLAPECVEAGLAPPSLMKAYFYLTDYGPVHRNLTIPHVYYRYRVKALPTQCQGEAVQAIQVRVRFKTANFPVKNLWIAQIADHFYLEPPEQWDPENPPPLLKKTWMMLYAGDGGTGVSLNIPPSGYMVVNNCQPWRGWLGEPGTAQNVFGAVQNASAIERRIVKEVGSGSVWTRTRTLPVKFARNRLAWAQTDSSSAGCEPGQPLQSRGWRDWTKGVQWLE